MALRIPYTKNEDELIGTLFMLKKTDAEIAAQIAATLGKTRTIFSINSRRYKLGLIAPNRPQAVARIQAHQKIKCDAIIAGDVKFKRAMLLARSRGQEHVVIGVIKDHRPFALNTIHAEPMQSMCGSAADMCASSV